VQGWHIPPNERILGMDKKWLIYGLIFLAGVYAAPKVRTLPLLGKLPTA
jgi:hypothetical protein